MRWPVVLETFIPTKWEVFSFDEVQQDDFKYEGIGYVVGAKPNEGQLKQINSYINDVLLGSQSCGGPIIKNTLDLPSEFSLTTSQWDRVSCMDLNPIKHYGRHGWAVYGNYIRGCEFSIFEAVVIRGLVARMTSSGLSEAIVLKDLSHSILEERKYRVAQRIFDDSVDILLRDRVLIGNTPNDAVKVNYLGDRFQLVVNFPSRPGLVAFDVHAESLTNCLGSILGKFRK